MTKWLNVATWSYIVFLLIVEKKTKFPIDLKKWIFIPSLVIADKLKLISPVYDTPNKQYVLVFFHVALLIYFKWQVFERDS